MVSKIIWLIEYVFFFPKLRHAIGKIHLAGKEQFIFFDVGANKGQSIRFIKRIHNNSLIYAFEPIPQLCEYLKRYASANLLVFQIAIGSKSGISNFYLSKFKETSSMLLPNQDSSWHLLKSRILGVRPTEMYSVIKVQEETLDNFVRNYSISSISLLKIDVEGYELQVLKGAIHSISSGLIQNIQLEQHQNDMRRNESNEISEFLDSYNFELKAKIRHSFGNFYDLIYSRKVIQEVNDHE